jgi:hypothetical protein
MADNRPHVLFLARSFPPVATIAAIRTTSIARYLARAGWKVTVVAPDPRIMREPTNPEGLEELRCNDGVEIVHTDHGLRCLLPLFFRQEGLSANRLIGGTLRRLAVQLDLDDGAGWVRPVLKSTRSLKKGEVDLVLASAAPFSSFVLARLLGKRLGCPYVLDYRDPWTHRDFKKVEVRPWTRALERWVCAKAGAILHVSPMLIQQHVEQFGREEVNHAVTNGYDPEVLDRIKPETFDHRAIVYTGRFYPPIRVIHPVLRALALLHADPSGRWEDVRFHYYGVDSAQFQEAVRECGVAPFVMDHGRVQQGAAFAATKGAAVTVVVTSVSNHVNRGVLGNLPGKLFESIGLGVPLLLISPDGSQARQILEQTESGLGCHGESTENVAAVLKTLLAGYSGKRSTRAADVSWPRLVQHLDAIVRPLAISHKMEAGH